MRDLSQALASPAAWEEPDRAARLAPRLPEETGLAAPDAELLPRLLDLLPLLPGRTRTDQEALSAALRHANAKDAEALARRLRRHKLIEVLRIALRDLGGRAALAESARELSWLAACVLGMGKLGGTELNFSSDVDLLYVYDRDGRTQGPQAIDHFAFYARLAEEVTRAIGATPFVFRVDLDLRPEGRSG